MTDEPGRGASEEAGGFDWASPRWRDADDDAGDIERERRYRDTASPAQRGAIDEDGSIHGERGALGSMPPDGPEAGGPLAPDEDGALADSIGHLDEAAEGAR